MVTYRMEVGGTWRKGIRDYGTRMCCKKLQDSMMSNFRNSGDYLRRVQFGEGMNGRKRGISVDL